jgi:hypothetical protein
LLQAAQIAEFNLSRGGLLDFKFLGLGVESRAPPKEGSVMLFGNPPIDPAELLRILVSEIPAAAKDDSRPAWTQAAKEVICRLGKDRHFKPFASAHLHEERLREWVLDIVWYVPTKTAGVQLAVESEFGGYTEVLDDFEKLMCIKAPMKLMIFDVKGAGKPTDEVVKGLEQYLTDFDHNVAGEIYLLIDFSRGKYESFRFTVPKDGKLARERVRFERVASGLARSAKIA